jgi:hypothetical protein
MFCSGTSAYYPTKTFDSLAHFTGGQFALAAGGQFEMADGGYFTVARGGQFAWVFHLWRGLNFSIPRHASASVVVG